MSTTIETEDKRLNEYGNFRYTYPKGIKLCSNFYLNGKDYIAYKVFCAENEIKTGMLVVKAIMGVFDGKVKLHKVKPPYPYTDARGYRSRVQIGYALTPAHHKKFKLICTRLGLTMTEGIQCIILPLLAEEYGSNKITA